MSNVHDTNGNRSMGLDDLPTHSQSQIQITLTHSKLWFYFQTCTIWVRSLDYTLTSSVISTPIFWLARIRKSLDGTLSTTSNPTVWNPGTKMWQNPRSHSASPKPRKLGRVAQKGHSTLNPCHIIKYNTMIHCVYPKRERIRLLLKLCLI